jgi:hypothetical protein
VGGLDDDLIALTRRGREIVGQQRDRRLRISVGQREAPAEITASGLSGTQHHDDDQAELGPAPGLDDLGRLITEVTAAGVTVDLHIDSSVPALSPAADLSSYRIVQEALTNVVRHAGPTRARVQVSYRPGEVSIEVTDDGPSGARHPQLPGPAAVTD